MVCPAGLGVHGTYSGEGGQQNRIRTTEEQWDWIENKHPGLMKHLYDEFMDSFTGDAKNRSLLSDIRGDDLQEVILSKLIGETADNYTEKINAVLLNCFEEEEIRTTREYGAYRAEKYGPCNPIHVRLAATDTDVAACGSDSSCESASDFDSESKSEFDGEDIIIGGMKETKMNPIAQNKALQVMLAYNHFIGGTRTIWGDEKPSTFSIGGVPTEWEVQKMLERVRDVFNQLFRIFEALETGIEVKAVNGHQLPQGGFLDFGVLVSGLITSEGLLKSVREYPAIMEFKPPNACLGIAWKLLNGQGWTPDECSAFFKLRDISIEAFDDVRAPVKPILKQKLDSWQKHAAGWAAAEAVLDQIGPRRVEVKYSLSGDTAKHKQSTGKLESLYFVRTGDACSQDITRQFEDAKFKDCFDSCHEALADAATYGALNNCTRVAISNGLTFIAGSLQKVEKSGGSYSSGSEDVFDIHLRDTAMIQTHDKNSALYMLEYITEAAMSNTILRTVGDYLITATDDEYQDGEITGAHWKDVTQRMQEHNFSFNFQNHTSKDLMLVESSKQLSVKVRGQVLQALAAFDVHFPGIKSKAAQFTSDTFAICEWFRENAFEGVDSSVPWQGRSMCVAKVVKRHDCDGKRYVLKEYLADELSVSKMSHELEAYARISRLPTNERKHVAELASFGSLDLDAGNPRLYLLLQYVEEHESTAMDSADEEEEVDRVDDILESVGVSHNDLEDRNYRWQRDSEGSWYIKVFDFDHATFSEELEMEE